MLCGLRSASVGKYVDCRNMHVVTLNLLILSVGTTGTVYKTGDCRTHR